MLTVVQAPAVCKVLVSSISFFQRMILGGLIGQSAAGTGPLEPSVCVCEIALVGRHRGGCGLDGSTMSVAATFVYCCAARPLWLSVVPPAPARALAS